MKEMVYVIRRDDGGYPLSSTSLEELQTLRSEHNRGFINHYYDTVAEYYEHGEYRYIDIYTKQECSPDGKCIYVEWSDACFALTHEYLVDKQWVKDLQAEQKVLPALIRTNKPYPPYNVVKVNKDWYNAIMEAFKKHNKI